MKLPAVVGKGRREFSLGCHNRSPTEAEVVVFGGVCYGFVWCGNALRGIPLKGDTTLLSLGTYVCIQKILTPQKSVWHDTPNL